jgi:phage terminase large subunit-like protein
MTSKHPAIKYAEDVLSGKILACKWVKLACKRYFEDIKNQKDKGFYFDEKAAQHAIDFFKFLKHSKGEWCGEAFELEPWQQFILWNLFGWKNKPTGYRRFKTCYLEVARKNGKTTMLAGIGLYLFFGDGEPGAEIYTAATKRDQARISHSEATRMVKSSASLRKRITIFKDNLNIMDTASKFEPLGADADTMDGLNIHGALIDELHAHKTRNVWDILETATGSRRQPLQIAITTSGFDRHSICFEQHSYLQKILEKVYNDETYFGLIYTLDGYDGGSDEDKDDWQDQKVWIKANPNLGISVKHDDLERKCDKAKELATAQNSFLRLHMDIWTESETRWITVDQWNECGFDVHEQWLRGRMCYGGLDLSSTTDTTALIWLFPPEKDGDSYEILCRFFIPEDNMLERVRKDRVPYDVWVREGFITATSGNVLDYANILNTIANDTTSFNVQELAFDRWGSQKITTDLQDIGFEIKSDSSKSESSGRTLVQFGQGFASMSSPSKELERLILSKMIAHNNNPVLAWMMSNVVIKIDPAGNIKPDKEKSIERIDGVVALVMAIDRAVRQNNTSSVYESRGAMLI